MLWAEYVIHIEIWNGSLNFYLLTIFCTADLWKKSLNISDKRTQAKPTLHLPVLPEYLDDLCVHQGRSVS